MPHNPFSITDYAKDTVLSVLQEFFSNEKNVGAELLFNRELDQSKVLIADKYTYNLDDVEKRPGVVVMRGAQTWTRRGLDQFKGWEGPNTAERFTDLVQGTFTCQCMSKVGIEAESIAHLVFGFFQFFRRALRDRVKGIHDITSIALGEELVALSDSKVEVSVVPVTIVLMFQLSWKLEQQGPMLRDVDVTIKQKNAEVLTKFLKCATPIGA